MKFTPLNRRVKVECPNCGEKVNSLDGNSGECIDCGVAWVGDWTKINKA